MNYSEEDLLQEYLKAVDLLTINETNRLKKKVDILKEKEDEIQSLKEQMKRVQSQLQFMAQKMKETEKLSNHAEILGTKLMNKFGITKRPTKKELEDYRKRVLASEKDEN